MKKSTLIFMAPSTAAFVVTAKIISQEHWIIVFFLFMCAFAQGFMTAVDATKK